MVSLFTPGFEMHQNEQNVPADGGGSVCKAQGAHKWSLSSQDKGQCSEKQLQVVHYKQQIDLTG